MNAARNAWTVDGGGADIWTRSDQFHLLSQPHTGDGSIVARVSSLPTNLDGTVSTNAKAGVMFRASTGSQSPMVTLVYDHTLGVHLLYRDTLGAAAAQAGPTIAISAAPFWLKLVRSGNGFTAYRATTAGAPGTNDWLLITSHTPNLPNFARRTRGLLSRQRNAGGRKLHERANHR